MSEADRARWNRTWSAQLERGAPSKWLRALAGRLPNGRALDVAGGPGHNAEWLAALGMEVTLVDVSEVALSRATGVKTECRDLEREGIPRGPWDVIVCLNYLQRELFAAFAAELSPRGLLVFAQPTLRNLERHPRPSERFLLAEGELAVLATKAGLKVLELVEGWTEEGRHEARLLAQKRGVTHLFEG